MKNKSISIFSHVSKKIAAVVICLGLIVASSPALATQVEAAASDWTVKGVSITSQWSGDFASEGFKQSVQNAKDMGVNYITLVIPYVQSNAYSSDVGNHPNTPSDETLISAIQYIHGLGLKVALKPHLEEWGGNWRGNIQASDRGEWYNRYGTMLNHLGDIGKNHGVEMIVAGTELIGMASSYVSNDNTEQWRAMISALRTRYPGLVTYSANWGHGQTYVNEFEYIKFWDALDFIGISAYFPHPNSDGSASSLVESWRRIDQNQISALQSTYNKPVLFSEVGFKSMDGAHQQPWDSGRYAPYNGWAQQQAYEGLFQYWNTRSYFSGLMIWDWHSDPNHGGEGNIDYSPHNKPAEGTIHTWFTQGGGSNGGGDNGGGDNGGGTNPPPDPTGEFGASSTGASNVWSGQETTIPVVVTSSGDAKNVIADIEIYDANDNKIFQRFFEGQDISQTSSKTYNVQWIPSTDGSYTVKVGIFKYDWSHTYYWNNSVTTIAVGSVVDPDPDPDPDPQTFETNIWWPTDGANVSGIQPFKAMIEGKDVSEYEMYWQVDGNGLVQMYNSDVDYPHKEFMVDLSSWTWKGSGPYTVNFVSKDHEGSVISEKAVDIWVITW
ncbi:MAG: hypothetical protein Q8L64_05215 [bacterium]|nr:hypothetical protein [bacterium]